MPFITEMLFVIMLLINPAYAAFQSPEQFKKAIANNAETLKNMQINILNDDPSYEYKDENSIFLYSKNFAERFNLDPKKTEVLDENLYAIELVIKKSKFFYSGSIQDYFNIKNLTYTQHEIIKKAIPAIEILYQTAPQPPPVAFHYDCYLNLYADSSLPILYPGDGEMNDHDAYYEIMKRSWLPVNKNMIEPLKLNEPEKEDFNKEKLKFLKDYSYKAFLSSNVFGKNGNPDSFKILGYPVRYYRYLKDWAPNINYISLGPIIDCKNLNKKFNSLFNNKPLILLERIGGKNYEKNGYSYFENDNLMLTDFIYIKLPNVIFGTKYLTDVMHIKNHVNT